MKYDGRSRRGTAQRLVAYYQLLLKRAGQAGIDMAIVALYRLDKPFRRYNFTVSVDALFQARDKLRALGLAAPVIGFMADGIEFIDGKRADAESFTAGSPDLALVWEMVHDCFEVIRDRRGGFNPTEILHFTAQERIPLMIMKPMKMLCTDDGVSEHECQPPEVPAGIVADGALVTELQTRFRASFGAELAVLPEVAWFSSGWDGNNLQVKNAIGYFVWGTASRSNGPERTQEQLCSRDPVACQNVALSYTTVGAGFNSSSCVQGKRRDPTVWRQDLTAAWADTAGNWVNVETFDFWWEGSETLCSKSDGCDYFDAMVQILGQRRY